MPLSHRMHLVVKINIYTLLITSLCLKDINRVNMRAVDYITDSMISNNKYMPAVDYITDSLINI